MDLTENDDENVTNRVLEYYEKYARNPDLTKYFTGPEADLTKRKSKQTFREEKMLSKQTNTSNSEFKICTETSREQLEDQTSPSCSIIESKKLEWDNGADIGYSNSNLKVSTRKSASFPSIFTEKSKEEDIEHLRSMYHQLTFSAGSSCSLRAEENLSENSSSPLSRGATSNRTSQSPPVKDPSFDSSPVESSNSKSSKSNNSNKMDEYLRKIGFPDAKSTPNEELKVKSGDYFDFDTPKLKKPLPNVENRQSVHKMQKEINLCITKPVQMECYGNLDISNKESQTSFNASSKSVQTEKKSENFSTRNEIKSSSSASNSSPRRKNSKSSVRSDNPKSENVSRVNSDGMLLAEMISLKHSHNLNSDIKRSIDILQKLLKSKKYDQATKKFYIRKIVEKIVESKYSDDSSTSSELFRPKRTEVSLMDNKPWYPANQNQNEPQTKPEIDQTSGKPGNFAGSTSAPSSDGFVFYKPKSAKETVKSKSDVGLSNEKNWRVSKTLSERVMENRGKRLGQGDYLVSVATDERQHQLSWIKNEIEHLDKLREMLEKKTKPKKNDQMTEVIESLLKMRVDDINGLIRNVEVCVCNCEKTNEKCDCCCVGDKKPKKSKKRSACLTPGYYTIETRLDPNGNLLDLTVFDEQGTNKYNYRKDGSVDDVKINLKDHNTAVKLMPKISSKPSTSNSITKLCQVCGRLFTPPINDPECCTCQECSGSSRTKKSGESPDKSKALSKKRGKLFEISCDTCIISDPKGGYASPAPNKCLCQKVKFCKPLEQEVCNCCVCSKKNEYDAPKRNSLEMNSLRDCRICRKCGKKSYKCVCNMKFSPKTPVLVGTSSADESRYCNDFVVYNCECGRSAHKKPKSRSRRCFTGCDNENNDEIPCSYCRSSQKPTKSCNCCKFDCSDEEDTYVQCPIISSKSGTPFEESDGCFSDRRSGTTSAFCAYCKKAIRKTACRREKSNYCMCKPSNKYCTNKSVSCPKKSKRKHKSRRRSSSCGDGRVEKIKVNRKCGGLAQCNVYSQCSYVPSYVQKEKVQETRQTKSRCCGACKPCNQIPYSPRGRKVQCYTLTESGIQTKKHGGRSVRCQCRLGEDAGTQIDIEEKIASQFQQTLSSKPPPVHEKKPETPEKRPETPEKRPETTEKRPGKPEKPQKQPEKVKIRDIEEVQESERLLRNEDLQGSCHRNEVDSECPLQQFGEFGEDVPTRDLQTDDAGDDLETLAEKKVVSPVDAAPKKSSTVKSNQTATHEEKRIQHPSSKQCRCQTDTKENAIVQCSCTEDLSCDCDEDSTESTSCSSSSKSHMSCICCKKERIFENLRGRLPLCSPCQQVNMKSFYPYTYTNPLHKCLCYSLIDKGTMNELQNTLNELERLNIYHQYCEILKNCKCCKKCGCQCKLPKKYMKGFAYFLKFEEGCTHSGRCVKGDECEGECNNDEESESDNKLPEVTVKICKGPCARKKKKKKKSSDESTNSECQGPCAKKDKQKNKKEEEERVTSEAKSSLQAYLCMMKPNFVEKAEWRRKVLRDAALERGENVEARKLKFMEKIDYLNKQCSIKCEEKVTKGTYGDGQAKTVCMFDVQYDVPPQRVVPRVFRSFKEMKDLTRRKYLHLNEVRSKNDVNKEKRLKEANRILANTFTKRLQRSTLRGAVDIPHSVRVISY